MSHRTRRTPLALLAAVGLAALTLTGCSGIVPNVQQLTQNAIEGIAENATGVDVGIDAGSGVALPPEWPGLPTPDGQLVSTIAADGVISLSYLVADDAAALALKTALVAEGFEVTVESLGDLNAVVLTNPEWTISLSWVADGSGQGMFLNYGITPTP